MKHRLVHWSLGTLAMAIFGWWCLRVDDRKRGAFCEDCKRPYGDEHGFPDLVVPLEAWKKISTTGDESGLLCPSCICRRLHDAGLRDVPAAFMSGPIRSVDSKLMEQIRWTESFRAAVERTVEGLP